MRKKDMRKYKVTHSSISFKIYQLLSNSLAIQMVQAQGYDKQNGLEALQFGGMDMRKGIGIN
jgi:hypothetical protein